MNEYTVRVHKAIGDVDRDEWKAAGAHGLLMDPAFIAAAERALAGQLRMWHVVFHDGARPVACASIGLYRADLAVLTAGVTRTAINAMRKVARGLGRINMLFCGLPISIGQNSIGFADGCDKTAVLERLDDLMEQLAVEHGALLRVFKEFTPEEMRELDALQRRGYLPAETPNLYVMERRHASFDEYCAALTSHYRYDITRSRKKFAKASFEAERLRDRERIAAVYTDDVHRLYENVFAKAEHKLELLPASFFRALAEVYPGDVSLTLIKQNGNIAGFNYAVAFEDSYCYLFCGIDYQLNEKGDVYFNLMYREMDNWLTDGLPRVQMGQTSDEFKGRLGCDAVPLSCFVKGEGWFRWIVKAGAKALFPPRHPARPHSIYKNQSARS